MLQTKTPVLIVGGGIVGLSASLVLSQHGIRSLLIERHAGTSIHPRARGVNARTMEIYRGLGLEEKIREVGKELQPAVGAIKGATLREALEEFVPTQHQEVVGVLVGTGERLEISPTKSSRGTQDLVEPVLLQEARKRGSAVSFSTELLSLAVLAEQGTDSENVDLNGQPGTRVPHLWLSHQGERLSTVDLAGDSFVLLTGPDGDAWCAAALAAAARLHIELKAYRTAPDSEFSDPEQLWPDRAGIHTDGTLLVRPDGVVAWRSKAKVAEPQRLLEQVFSDLLAKAGM